MLARTQSATRATPFARLSQLSLSPSPYRCFSSNSSLFASPPPPSPQETSGTSPAPSRASRPLPQKRPQPDWVRKPGPPSAVGSSSSSTRSGAREEHRGYREPPLVEQARKKSVGQRSVFESYLVLPWNTRLIFWLTVGAIGVLGLYGGDYLVPESDDEKKEGEVKVAARDLAGGTKQ
ncbi:hypothetical protein JCM8547_006351 [Rhodosporidiobolus lusitaniae]